MLTCLLGKKLFSNFQKKTIFIKVLGIPGGRLQWTGGDSTADGEAENMRKESRIGGLGRGHQFQ